ncbi:MAG TPA: hypothetical protein VJ892_00380 [Candidatus Absconditabacterales bacterium]|nr:hypothetical protein [Candidatus Absconditabacterales bacterium]
MKKIIIFLFFAGILFSSSFVAAQSQSDCTNNPLGENSPGCIQWKSLVETKCTNAGGIVSWNDLDCQCTLFIGTQMQNTQSCDSVLTIEDSDCNTDADCQDGYICEENICYEIPESSEESEYIESQMNYCTNQLGGQASYDYIEKQCYCEIDGEKIHCCEGTVWDNDTKCCLGILVDDQENPGQKTCIINTEGSMGINMNKDCLINGQCNYNIYETLGIRKSDPNPSVGTFVQDIVLAATTFIGTVVALILVTSGILYVVASIRGSSNLADMAKKGITGSIMGIALVAGSYAIVRLVQFFATAGGG